jgi:hypothetical protein
VGSRRTGWHPSAGSPRGAGVRRLNRSAIAMNVDLRPSRAVPVKNQGVGTGLAGPTLCSASKPYNEDDADGQQGAGKPESDECLAPVRAVARRIEDPDADAPCVERPNERGEASKAERAESRRPSESAPKQVATGRVRAHGSMMRVAARPVNARSRPQRTSARVASTICLCEAESMGRTG